MCVIKTYDVRLRDVFRAYEGREVYLCGELVINGVMAGFVEVVIESLCFQPPANKIFVINCINKLA